MQTSTAVLVVGGVGVLAGGAYLLFRRGGAAMPGSPGAGQVYVPGVSSVDGAAKVVPLGGISSIGNALAIGRGTTDAGSIAASGLPAATSNLDSRGGLSGYTIGPNGTVTPASPTVSIASRVSQAVLPLGVASSLFGSVKGAGQTAVAQAVSSAGAVASATGLSQLASGNYKGAALAAITSPVSLAKVGVQTAVSTTTAAAKGAVNAVSGAASSVYHSIASIF